MKISEKHGMHLDLAQKWLQLHGCETSAYYFLCWTSFCWRTQTTNYFSSKKKRRILICGLQPWWSTCKSSHSKKRKTLLKRGREAGRTVVNKECTVFHWLSPDPLSLAELWPGKKRKSFFFFLGSAVVLGLKKPHSRLLTSFYLVDFSTD